jgi:hypothetical protein
VTKENFHFVKQDSINQNKDKVEGCHCVFLFWDDTKQCRSFPQFAHFKSWFLGSPSSERLSMLCSYPGRAVAAHIRPNFDFLILSPVVSGIRLLILGTPSLEGNLTLFYWFWSQCLLVGFPSSQKWPLRMPKNISSEASCCCDCLWAEFWNFQNLISFASNHLRAFHSGCPVFNWELCCYHTDILQS